LASGSTTAAQSQQESSSAPRPKAVVAETTFDFGTVTRGTTHRHAFVVENQGDAPLQIVSFNSTCACIVAEYDETIAPGATGQVVIELDSTTIEGAGQSLAQITTNDPDLALVRFVVKATSSSAIGYSPNSFRWYDMHRHFDGEATLASTFFSVDGEDFAIKSVTSPSPYVEVSFREATPEEREGGHPGKQYRVSATLSKEAPVGPLSGYIAVDLDHPVQRGTVLPISGFVRPVLAATPHEVKLGEVSLEQVLEVKIHIRHFTVWDVAIEKVEIDLPGVETSFETTKTPFEYYAVFRFTSAVPKGPFAATGKVTTTAKADAVLEIPISGTIIGAGTN
jgi:hypothetical protein